MEASSLRLQYRYSCANIGLQPYNITWLSQYDICADILGDLTLKN